MPLSSPGRPCFRESPSSSRAAVRPATALLSCRRPAARAHSRGPPSAEVPGDSVGRESFGRRLGREDGVITSGSGASSQDQGSSTDPAQACGNDHRKGQTLAHRPSPVPAWKGGCPRRLCQRVSNTQRSSLLGPPHPAFACGSLTSHPSPRVCLSLVLCSALCDGSEAELTVVKCH